MSAVEMSVEVAPELGGWKVSVIEPVPTTTFFQPQGLDGTNRPRADDIGDLWFVTETNEVRRWDGSDWELLPKLTGEPLGHFGGYANPYPRRVETTVLSHRRRKSSAVLVGTGAAMALKCELRVKNRKGQYTTAAASFGGDSPRRRG